MMKNTTYKAFLFLLVFLMQIWSCKTTSNSQVSLPEKNDKPSYEASKKPNIIIFLADDLGWNDVGYHNSEIETPNIDKLANGGVHLNRFYVNHTCTPSRVALMTGRYTGRLGLTNGVLTPERRDGIPPTEELLPEVLAEVGYQQRACIGKWHLGHSHVKYHPLNQGFTYFYGHYGGMIGFYNHKRRGQLDWHRNFETCYDEGYSTSLIGNEAVRYIEDTNNESPFFMYVAFNAPHAPLQAPEEYLDKYGYDMSKGIFEEGKVPSSPRKPILIGQGNTKRQTYAAMVTTMDNAIGRILNTLQKKGVKDNTIILFLSDNGGHYHWGGNNKPLRGEKGTLYEGGVRVPAFLYYPKLFKGGVKTNAMMGHIDIIPTLKSILGDTTIHSKQLDGIDMSKVIKGKEFMSDRIFYLGRSGLATQKWKLAYKQLYDIENDPNETKDLAKEQPEIFKTLSDTLQSLRASIELETKPDKSFKIQKEWKMPSD